MSLAVAPLMRREAAGATQSFIAAGAANQDSNLLQSQGGVLYGFEVFNMTATARFLKFYDKATAPTSADTPFRRIAIPGSTTVAGVVRDICGGRGVRFELGLGIRMTQGEGDSDATACAASDVIANIDFM